MNEIKVLEMKNIIKEFNTVRVLDQVNLDLNKGEVHAIIGANGAGKSTLMKILSGIFIKYEGEILLNGEQVVMRDPRDAAEKGISMIYQELDLVENLDVSANIFLGREIYKHKSLATLDRENMRVEAQQLLDFLKFPIKATEMVGDLPPSKQQLVLIARTYAMKSNVIIMDEPTSSLSINETNNLFTIIKSLRDQGISIIYISHYLEEIFRVADRVTVLRDGKKVITEDIANCTQKQLVEWMIGEKPHDKKDFVRDAPPGDVVLSVSGLTQKRGIVSDVSFELRKGEVLGIAGVVGSGRTELAKMIFGAEEYSQGQIVIEGKAVTINHPSNAVSYNMAFIPENRKTEGLILKRKINDNLWLIALRNSKNGIIDYKKITRLAGYMIDFLKIKCTSIEQEVAFLSGGNQQKVVIGKWLSTQSRILILDQPTRGVDVGSKEDIYQLIDSQAREGASILFISDELEELINLADRILIMKKGRVIKELNNQARTLSKADLLTPMVS